ncbi:hypothetical protein NAEGRDRAFT_78045 [Naegleria gruberi]|uniref:AAA-ATPase-like domain-containing protein n=1 Tax=Naegleria gruberi TaxID=5762 RepID=D2V0I2_NAEGR|nr:uncharacterized protein NAEGRDRAFT_78045 [Naegleria gruberi]EFC49725.1 hypothetical protein NAEGRDRAFT_78045 [Naegleria gruberi]|eukprot:XP_002682469.1 hypothetical protein NAEGRDRAFT_78045 [Naegleria gruberi strain NEG-M]
MKHTFLRKINRLQLFTASPKINRSILKINNLTNDINKFTINRVNQTKNYSNTLKPTTNNVENIKFKNIGDGNLLVPYFPYGESDFASIRRSKQFYVDKTNLIPLLEESGKQLFFVRPPRWGKSLLLSMLSSYYDINKKDEFDELFSGLWIGDENNWTPGKNQYHVLKLDFSIQVDGTTEDINQRLHEKVNTSIYGFLRYYELTKEMDINHKNSFDTLATLVAILIEKGAKLMILIDEYDRFANKLMFENPEKYQLIVEGKRGDPTSSPIRSFFERLKESSGVGLQDFRSIITGITPIALADASGYNVSSNISFDKIFGGLVGFTENDLRMALNNIDIIGNDQDITISTMKKYYKGYHFPGSKHALFNTTLSMFFLNKLVKDEPFRNAVLQKQEIPLSILTDTNTMISENVFATLASSVVSNDIIQQLLSKDYVEVTESIYPSLKLREIIDPPSNEEDIQKIRDNALSFMYYHGMVTFTKESSKQMNPKQLLIPNEIAKVQYLEQLRRLISLHENDVSTFINEPTQDNLRMLLNNILEKQETIYDNSMSEGGLQASIESALRAYCLFRNKELKIQAEKEYHVKNSNNKEYIKRADLVIRTSKKVLIIEFKRIRPNSLTKYSNIEYWNPQIFKNIFKDLSKQTDEELLEMEVLTHAKEKVVARSILNSAISQVKQYAQYENDADKSKSIHKYAVIQVGWPLIVRKLN